MSEGTPMAGAEIEDAYREAAPLVHTLALRALGSVDEAEDVVRRVFAAAAASGDLAPQSLLRDAAERVTGDLERRVRAKLSALDDPRLGADAVTDHDAVVAEADRILLRSAMTRLDEQRRTLLERALVHGDPRTELAMMTGVSVEDLEDMLRDALLELWTGPRMRGEHAPAADLASRALGNPAAPPHSDHLGRCRECRDVSRSLNDLVGAIARMPSAGPVVSPRAGLWDEVREAVAAGAVPEPDWREEARRAAERAQRRRTFILVGAVVMSSLLVGLTVILAQLLVEPDRAAVASAVLADPRQGGADAGSVVLERRDGGAEVLVIDTVFAEYPDAYLEVWLVPAGEDPISVGHLRASRYEVEVPEAAGSAMGATIEISREPWDGDPTRGGEVVARGALG